MADGPQKHRSRVERLGGRLLIAVIEGPGPWWIAPAINFSALGLIFWGVGRIATSGWAWWLWPTFGAAAVSGLWMSARQLQWRHYRWLAAYTSPYRCPLCDYSLIGLPGGRCPECGSTPDEHAERARRVLARAPRWRRELMRPDAGDE